MSLMAMFKNTCRKKEIVKIMLKVHFKNGWKLYKWSILLSQSYNLNKDSDVHNLFSRNNLI